jgi:hypothetical protein
MSLIVRIPLSPPGIRIKSKIINKLVKNQKLTIVGLPKK